MMLVAGKDDFGQDCNCCSRRVVVVVVAMRI